MTTTRKPLGETPDGNHVWDLPAVDPVPAWDPDAIARMYDEAKANIADEAGVWADDEDEPWPATEAIDLDAIRPPAATADPDPEAVEAPAAPRSPRRGWRSWFSGRSRADV